ncbi:MBL fold metallo-hydrolase [Nanoarchaeota archaeon]|nr:MAG: MBL fold metallo-hydrolase [Nanoarchaeota archaeon]
MFIKARSMRTAVLSLILLIALLILILGMLRWGKQHVRKSIEMGVIGRNVSNITIVDVYDNVGFDPKFRIGFGFGCVVKLGNNTILFDTGGDSQTLLENLKVAGIKVEDINIVVLSHIHGDHTGGLLGFLEKNPNVKVFIPKSFPQSFKEEIVSKGAEVIEVSEQTKIVEGVYSTGELGTLIKEQSLILDSTKGLVVITGCAHPGILNIVRRAKDLFNKEVYLVMGGFHYPPTTVAKELKKLGVKKVAPSHCTGEEAMKALEEEYQEDFIRSGVGKVIEV